MKLVSVQLPTKKKEEYPGIMSSEAEKWPYGLRLNFESAQVDNLPVLKSFDVGDKVYVYGEASIVTISQNDRMRGKNSYTVSMQIEKVNVEKKNKKVEKMSPEEYKEMRSKNNNK